MSELILDVWRKELNKDCTIQEDAFPDIPWTVIKEKKTRKMHNSKLYLSLINQIEIAQSQEIERLTGNFIYKLLSKIGILPRRRPARYGYFIKE